MRLAGARYSLTSRLAVAAIAGYGLAWRRGCGRWLPVSQPLSRHPRGLRAGMRRRYWRGAVAPWRTAEISSTWFSSPAATFMTSS